MLLKPASFLWLLVMVLSICHAQAQHIDLPLNGTQYSLKDSIHILAKNEKRFLSFRIKLKYKKTGQVVLDSTTSLDHFAWAIPDDVLQGDYLLTITDSNSISQIVSVVISKNHLSSYYYDWYLITYHGGYTPHDGAGVISFKNKLWMLGGWNPTAFDSLTSSQVYSSSDDGASWQFELDAPWEGRHVAGWVTFKDSIWVIGGDNLHGHYINDVWNSADGLNWHKVIDSLPMPHRMLHMGVAFKDKLFVIGGEQLPLYGTTDTTHFADIWSSPDGRTWTKEVDEAPFGHRGMVLGNLNIRDSLWVIGGGTYEPRTYNNDVWNSADGVHWNRKTAHAPFAPREYHNITYFDDKIFVTGGFNLDLTGFNIFYGNIADTWYSDNGVDWQEVPTSPWFPRHAHNAIASEESLTLLCAPLGFADVWKLFRRSDSIRLNFAYDTLFVTDDKPVELYTERVPGFTYNWYNGADEVNADNRLITNVRGAYTLITHDLFGYETVSKQVVIHEMDFNISPDDVTIFRGDQIYQEDIVSSRLLNNGAVSEFTLLNTEGDQYPDRIYYDTTLIVKLKYNDIPLLDTVSVKVVSPRPHFTGDFILSPGDTTTAEVMLLTGYQYKWFKDDVWISNVASNKLKIYDAGTYHVEIYRNELKVCQSGNFAFTTTGFINPENEEIFSGDEIQLKVSDTTGYLLKWYRNGTLIDEADIVSLGDPGEYYVEVYIDTIKVFTSDTFQIYVYTPTVSIDGDSVLIEGQTTNLSVPKLDLYTYKWVKDNNTVVGTSDKLVVKGEGTYKCIISRLGMVKATSRSIVIDKLSFDYQLPDSVALFPGDALEISTTPYQDVDYQWLKDGNLFDEGTNRSSITVNEPGLYRLSVSRSNASTLIDSTQVEMPAPSFESGLILPTGDIYSVALPRYYNTSFALYKEGDKLFETDTNSFVLTTTGTYSVQAIGNSGSYFTDSFTVTFKDFLIASAPESIPDSGSVYNYTVVSPFYNTPIDWYQDTKFVASGTDSVFHTNLSGQFHAEMTSATGNRFRSNNINLDEVFPDFTFRVENDLLHVQVRSDYTGPFYACLYGLSGETFSSVSADKKLKISQFDLQLPDIGTQLLILYYKTNKQIVTRKVLFQRP